MVAPPPQKKKKTQLSTPPLNYYTETKSIQIETTLKYYYLLNPQLTKDCSVAKKVISVQCDYVSKMQPALKKEEEKIQWVQEYQTRWNNDNINVKDP